MDRVQRVANVPAEPGQHPVAVTPPQAPTLYTSPRRNQAIDPLHGTNLQALLAVEPPKPPDDFERFWRTRYSEARRTPSDVRIEAPTRVGNHDIHVIRYNGVDGRLLGGYLALPVDATPDNAVLYAHGYGGCDAPDAETLAENGPRTAMLFACTGGFGLSQVPGVSSDATQHVVDGIDSPETYELGHSVQDIWSATSALIDAVPTARERIYLDGTSFGGGIGTMALAFDRRFARAYLEVPTFGAQPLRLETPSHGSAEAVRHYANGPRRNRVLRTLRYFDAATAARFVRVPTMVSAATRDAFVLPAGQFAIYNGLAGPRRLFVMSAGHAPISDREEDVQRAARRRWFAMNDE